MRFAHTSYACKTGKCLEFSGKDKIYDTAEEHQEQSGAEGELNN